MGTIACISQSDCEDEISKALSTVVAFREGVGTYSFSALQIILVEIIPDVELEEKHWFYEDLLHVHYVLGAETEQKQTQMLHLGSPPSHGEGGQSVH